VVTFASEMVLKEMTTGARPGRAHRRHSGPPSLRPPRTAASRHRPTRKTRPTHCVSEAGSVEGFELDDDPEVDLPPGVPVAPMRR